jgi:hypothetical protein
MSSSMGLSVLMLSLESPLGEFKRRYSRDSLNSLSSAKKLSGSSDSLLGTYFLRLGTGSSNSEMERNFF